MSAPILSRFPAAGWIKSFIKSFKESNDKTKEPDAKKKPHHRWCLYTEKTRKREEI